MATSSIELVVFDLGRVLVRICDGWTDAFTRAGVELPKTGIDPATRARLLEGVKRIEVGDATVDGFCETVAAELGLACADVTRMWRGYTLGPFPGAPELVHDLNAAGVTTACLSNTNEQHWQTLTDPADPHHAATSPLKHQFASHLIRARKPEAAAYAHVERETDTAPQSILFFDDLPENIAAATARGWQGVLVPRSENPVPMMRERLRDFGLLP